jgi:hypothetical protein
MFIRGTSLIGTRVDKEPNDENYNDIENDHGEENGNKGSCNSDSNDHGEGDASSTVVGCNNDAASIGDGHGGPINAS